LRRDFVLRPPPLRVRVIVDASAMSGGPPEIDVQTGESSKIDDRI